MTPADAIKAALIGNSRSELAVRLGGRVHKKKQPSRSPYAPRETLPCVVYFNVATTAPGANHGGWGSLRLMSWQLDVWAASYDEAEHLGQLVGDALEASGLGAQLLMQADGEAVGEGVRPELLKGHHRVTMTVSTWHQKEV